MSKLLVLVKDGMKKGLRICFAFWLIWTVYLDLISNNSVMAEDMVIVMKWMAVLMRHFSFEFLPYVDDGKICFDIFELI